MRAGAPKEALDGAHLVLRRQCKAGYERECRRKHRNECGSGYRMDRAQLALWRQCEVDCKRECEREQKMEFGKKRRREGHRRGDRRKRGMESLQH